MINSIPSTFYLVPLMFLLFLSLHQERKKSQIKQWQKSLNLPEHAGVFQQLYQNTNGFLLSQQARKKHDALDYVYGEIEFLPFTALLSLAKPDHETVFYDLGSGTGKAVLACAMVYPVRQSVGVELLPELHHEACQKMKQLELIKNYDKTAKKIDFILGDFLEVDLNNATIIFINSTSIFNPTWEKLCSRLDNLTQVKTIITTSKALLSKDFTVVIRTQVQMSWGVVLVFLHARKRTITNCLENIE